MNTKIQKSLSIIIILIASSFLILMKELRLFTTSSQIFDYISVISYSALGSMILFLAYKYIDWLIPADIEKEIFDNQNLAAAIFKGIFLLSIAIIIAAVIITP